MIATDFIVLRNVEANSRLALSVEKKPKYVATLIDEDKFVASGHALCHLDTVFLEDQVHDWNWRDGQFSYYSRVAEKADVLLVYAVSR